MDRVCGQELRTVILDEAEETGKGKILDAGGGWASKECGIYSKHSGKLMEGFQRGLAKPDLYFGKIPLFAVWKQIIEQWERKQEQGRL